MNKQKIAYFQGPVFIIGMPRSGTKLLRELLNNHPMISIPVIETEFLSYWSRKWDIWQLDQGGYSEFRNFYRQTTKLPYFIYMAEKNALIKPEAWFNASQSLRLPDVFEALIKHDAHVKPNMIWGDKSPGYIRQMPLLETYFPNARFIHIIRDVRDYCLSMNAAWGKNMRRAAFRWTTDVENAMNIGRKMGESYLEITYENLIEKTEFTLQTVCNFLQIDFQPAMLSLSKPTENLGDAKKSTGILSGNSRKYQHRMTKKTRKSIEQIAHPLLRKLGYDCPRSSVQKRPSRFELLLFKCLDTINLVRRKTYTHGFGRALIFYFNSFRQTKN